MAKRNRTRVFLPIPPKRGNKDNNTFLIIWHPIYKEFVGSHESGNWISHTDLHKAVWIRNLKEAFVTKK
ncbi:hypothetical protein BK785_09375 [Bacillus thuringiensis serovar bolivia]|nr:hypothetical protein BK785_09375 [Bacillus thuringiensis serovar bolivia]OUA80062.1 hypothetical protein BK787_03700 [Bacillus thuringiensis serovar pahangi]